MEQAFSRRPYRWTRERYRAAASLARLAARNPYDWIWERNPHVQAYQALWDAYPSDGDPLQRKIPYRYDEYCPDGVPF